MNKIDFRTSRYFPWTITLLGVLLGLAGLSLMLNGPVIGGILMVICLLTLTTHYRIRIDFDKKIYHDYVWLLGLKIGDKGGFENIEYLFIKKSKVNQTMNLRVASTTIRKEVYDGYLKFSDDNKLHLVTNESKKDLLDKLRLISTALKIKIIDYSEGEPTAV